MVANAALDLVTKEDLKRLAEARLDPALTILMPTLRAGREVRQNPIRFRNLLKKADERLSSFGVAYKKRQSRLAQLRAMLDDDDWWQHQSDGLAVFADADDCQMYRVPLPLEELVAVGRRFHVRPLVRLVQNDGHFYVLAVSQNHVRLMAGTQYSISEVDVEKLPTDLRSALDIDEYVESLQQHSTDRRGGMIFHGQGGSGLEVEKKDEIRQFFHRIDAPLSKFLGDQRAPLVFAGVQYLSPIFQETCSYAHLIDKSVTGNPDDLSSDALHSEAWSIVQPHFDAERQAALARYQNASRTDKATTQLDVIVRLAPHAGIDTLLVAEGARRWACLDEQFIVDSISDAYRDGAEELLNFAAVHTLANGGSVFSLPAEKMPSGQAAAALVRFRLNAE